MPMQLVQAFEPLGVPHLTCKLHGAAGTLSRCSTGVGLCSCCPAAGTRSASPEAGQELQLVDQLQQYQRQAQQQHQTG